MQVVAERIGHHDGTNAASSPGGDGGAGDVDVPGQGPGAATHDVFSKTMVVGAPHGLRVQNSGDHPKSSPHGPEKINDIKGVAIANMKFIMSPCTAGMFLGTSCPDAAIAMCAVRDTGLPRVMTSLFRLRPADGFQPLRRRARIVD